VNFAATKPTGRRSTYRRRNGVSTRPSTSNACLWHGQVRRSLDFIEETAVKLEAMAEDMAPVAAAQKVARLLRDLETYVSGQSEIIIDYAKARRCDEPISTAITESTVQWLLHWRMNAQQMRWSPRSAQECAFDIESPYRCRKRNPVPRLCSRRALGPSTVSEGSLNTPGF
jgi:hypothetical protein